MKITPKVNKVPATPPAKSAADPSLPGWLFKPVERPAFADTIKFPDDITKLPLSGVSMLNGQYTGMYAYAVAELSKANVQVLRIRSEIFVRRNNIARTGITNGRKKYAIDLDTRIDKRLEELTLMENKAEELVKQLESYVIIFDKYMGALSREMTRRTAEMQRT